MVEPRPEIVGIPREQILETASSAIMTNGFAGTSIDDILNSAGRPDQGCLLPLLQRQGRPWRPRDRQTVRAVPKLISSYHFGPAAPKPANPRPARQPEKQQLSQPCAGYRPRPENAGLCSVRRPAGARLRLPFGIESSGNEAAGRRDLPELSEIGGAGRQQVEVNLTVAALAGHQLPQLPAARREVGVVAGP